MSPQIHPTNHAIERFEQRIMPHIPGHMRMNLDNHDKVKSFLYGLSRRADIPESDSRVVKVPEYISVPGALPIPVTLVIDLVARIILTTYITSGWNKEARNGSESWVWSS